MKANAGMPATFRQLQAECEMRAADNLKLCKEIDALNAKIEAVREYADYRKKHSPCCRDILKLLTGGSDLG